MRGGNAFYQIQWLFKPQGTHSFDPFIHTKQGINNKKQGCKRSWFLLFIPNTEIHKNFQGFCEYIDYLVEQSLSHLVPSFLHKGGGVATWFPEASVRAFWGARLCHDGRIVFVIMTVFLALVYTLTAYLFRDMPYS